MVFRPFNVEFSRYSYSPFCTAVIDTNAIVKGFRLETFAEEAVTIPEVLAEVKDKQAGAYTRPLLSSTGAVLVT